MKRKNIHLSAEEQALIESLLHCKANDVEPRTEFRDELYGRLVRSYMHQQPKDESRAGNVLLPFHGFFRFWLVTAVVLLSVAGTGLTTAYAYVSPSVTRASNLYFLKRTVESLELLASSSPEKLSRLHLKLASRRLEEAAVLTERGMVDEPTLQEIVSNTEQAEAIASVMEDSRTQIALNTYIAEETQRQRTNLVSLVRQLESETSGMSVMPSSETEASSASLSSASASSASEGPSDVVSSIPSESPPFQPTSGVAVPATSDAKTVGALEKTIANIGKVEMSATSTAMKISQESGFVQSTPQRLADLSVLLEPGFGVREGESFSVNVIISNVGQRGAPDTEIVVIWGDGTSDTLTVLALERGDEHQIRLKHVYRSPGTYVIRVQVDPSALLSELTTANNRAADSVEITSVPRDTCPGEGVRRCVGQDLQVCRYVSGAEALSWDVFETCAGNATCSVNGCRENFVCPTVCEEGQKRCFEKNVQQCVRLENGCVNWEDQQTCYGNQYCGSGQCRSPVCGNGVREGNLEECDDGNTVGGDGCSSRCLMENETCSDSDGGRVSTIKGTVRLSRSGEARTDICRTSGTLEEFFCNGSTFQSSILECINGCSDGACLSQPKPVCGNGTVEAGEECDDGNKNDGDGCTITCLSEQCSDSDVGKDPFVAGTVRYGVRGSKTGQDTCRDNNFVTEHYCYGNGHSAIDTHCQFGCRDGACLRQTAPVCSNGIVEDGEECDDGNVVSGDGCSGTCRKEVPPSVTCTDSDGGIVPAKKGTTSIIKIGGGTSATDFCDSTGALREYYCSGHSSISSVVSTCQYGCKDGACLSQPVSVCGNGKIEEGEQCDDGNTNVYDMCGSTCKIQADRNKVIYQGVRWETEHYDKTYDLYSLTFYIEVENPDKNYPVPKFSVIATSKQPAWGASGEIDLAPGERKVGIAIMKGGKAGKYTFNIQIHGQVQETVEVIVGPVCGNATLETGEQCDDGNAVNGDGCSSICQKEITADVSSLNSWPPSIILGNSIVYQIQVTNRGPAAAENVRVFHLIDPRLQFNQLPANCSKDGSDQTLICVIGTIQSNTSNTITVGVRVPNDPTLCGVALSVASDAGSSTQDPSQANNESENVATVQCPTN